MSSTDPVQQPVLCPHSYTIVGRGCPDCAEQQLVSCAFCGVKAHPSYWKAEGGRCPQCLRAPGPEHGLSTREELRGHMREHLTQRQDVYTALEDDKAGTS